MAHDEREHLFELLDDFRVAMLTTHALDGALRGRPMLVAKVEDDGELVFCTRLDTGKVDEIDADPSCAVLLQGRDRWVSVTGFARIDQDRERIRALWRPSWRLWFPEGKHDPAIGLVLVRPTAAEYWDESGPRSLRFVQRAARRLLRLEPMTPAEPEQHAKIPL